MEVSLGVWNYHQLSIYVKCTHCLILEELIRIRKDINFSVQQARHSNVTEEQIYRVSIGYLNKLPENLVELYVNASTKW